MDKETGRVFQRELFLFYRRTSGQCLAYSFNYATLTVSALRAGRWVQIGEVYDDAGNIRLLPGMGWLP